MSDREGISLQAIQQDLGIEFGDLALLREALTHTSYMNENPSLPGRDNERLEFLGDAVLDFLIAEALFRRYPTAREGALTAMRAALVNTDSLACMARRLHIGSHLFLGKGEEASGGRQRIANLCASLEAVIGAIYLDRGVDDTRRLIDSLFSETIEALGMAETMRDAKSLLQECTQSRLHRTPFYRTISESGPDHAKEFLVQVFVDDQVLGTGSGSNKHAAEQAAARAALDALAGEADQRCI